jgi:membrane protease YdiL (CAAX protease family)
MEKIKPLTWPQLILLFGIPALLNEIACGAAIPLLYENSGMPIEICYFLSVGLIVLVPMFFGALWLSGKDTGSYKLSVILERMRIRKLSLADTWWTIGGFIFLSLTSFLIAKIILPMINIDAAPFFFKNMPLKDGYMYILYVWPLFFFFNIFGEEFLWRGYILPRQELLNGKWTWLVHGIFWAGFHIPMGFDLMLSALPIFFILPAIVQVRKNTTISIIIHFVFGAFGFLALALGAVH